MKWIKCSEKLPEHEKRCWAFIKDGRVLDLVFDKKTWRDEPGFRYEDSSGSLPLDEISHWMPYFTPEPPKEKE